MPHHHFIPIEVSARHVHLSEADADTLFGKGYAFRTLKDLSQTGQFAAAETVKLKGPRNEITDVRYLGPFRKQTQVEISKTDARWLGISAPVRLSGNLTGSGNVDLIGPKGTVHLEEGVIIAERHVHAGTEDAERIGLRNSDLVSVDIEGIRDLLFESVPVRVHPSFRLAFHIDTDEANAAGVQMGDKGILRKKPKGI